MGTDYSGRGGHNGQDDFIDDDPDEPVPRPHRKVYGMVSGSKRTDGEDSEQDDFIGDGLGQNGPRRSGRSRCDEPSKVEEKM